MPGEFLSQVLNAVMVDSGMNPSVFSPAGIVAGARGWLFPAGAIALIGLLLTAWLNRERLFRHKTAILLRAAVWLVLAACLADPLWSSLKPRAGSNVIAVVCDDSFSHQIRTSNGESLRSDVVADFLERGEMADQDGWLSRLEQDFEVRRYFLGSRLQTVETFGRPEFDAPASQLHSGLKQLAERFRGQPLAGVVLLTDGIATDDPEPPDDFSNLPPVYVVLPDETSRPDVGIRRVGVTQSAFDDAPVTLQVTPEITGLSDEDSVKVIVRDAEQNIVAEKTVRADQRENLRFPVRPQSTGTVFYDVEIQAEGKADADAAPLNNRRLVAVDRGSRPRRILYVSGRPNWEYKFVRRAAESDPRIKLAALIRIARKEAKFDFRGHSDEESNSLFRGFDKTEQELAEEYDEPVLVRLGTESEEELQSGFPQTEAELFSYDAVILDDIEARFFLTDQLELLREFVSRRGGGLLMTGGQESFYQGEYDHTPVGEILPVDLYSRGERVVGPVRLDLTRDGWLQSWVRIRNNEADERRRLDSMPAFATLNVPAAVRPGAMTLATVSDQEGRTYPGLVVQRFGRGRTAALCIGDFWKWRMDAGRRQLLGTASSSAGGNSSGQPGLGEDISDHARAVRQMLRWLVADVPQQVELKVRPENHLGAGVFRIRAAVMNNDFFPAESADVSFRVVDAEGREKEIVGTPADEEPGIFEGVWTAPTPGACRVTATVRLENEDPLTASTGWAWQPQQEELRTTQVNRRWAEVLCEQTGGQIVPREALSDTLSSLPADSLPIVDIHSWPVWNQWWILTVIIAGLLFDWGTRRIGGCA